MEGKQCLHAGGQCGGTRFLGGKWKKPLGALDDGECAVVFLAFPLKRCSQHSSHHSGLNGAPAHHPSRPPLLQIFPASAIQFAVFHGLKDAMLAARAKRAATETASSGSVCTGAGGGVSGELSNAERLVAGAAAGAASVAVTYPLESARTVRLCF